MKPLKILFADDDLKYSLLLKRFLEQEGYEVTYVGNGRMAVEQFPLVRPDLVLLDINMPELNGFEVAARIREADKHVLIFFLSDRSDKADRLQGFSLRANDYLAKPFYPEELIARIRERFALQLEGRWRRRLTASATPYSATIPTSSARPAARCSSLRGRLTSSACWP